MLKASSHVTGNVSHSTEKRPNVNPKATKICDVVYFLTHSKTGMTVR